MKTIKIFGNGAIPALRYHNRDNMINDEYQFIYDNDIRDCDVMVVFAEGGWNNVRFHTTAKRRILFTGEPSVIYRYNSDFFNQFTDIVTSQQDVPVNQDVKMHHICQCNDYFIGRDTINNRLVPDEILNTYNNRTKDKLISVVVSDKTFTEYHRKRKDFILHLKQDIPELDLFGTLSGTKLGMKDEALRNYKYSIAIENCCTDDYWTEKLADCIYSLTQPIYCGCTNIDSYFDGITKIDINDYEASLNTIRNTIKTVPDINRMIDRRNTMITDYSFHSVIMKILKGQI